MKTPQTRPHLKCMTHENNAEGAVLPLHSLVLPKLLTSCCCCSITQDSYPAIAGDYSTWVPPYSYASMDQLEENVGYKVNGTCLRNATLQQLLVCPAGQESLPANELADHCQVLNITCPAVSISPRFRQMQPFMQSVACVIDCLNRQAHNQMNIICENCQD